MIIRKALKSDVAHIADINTASWQSTYQNALTQHYLRDTMPSERLKVWSDRLNNPKPNQYLAIAEHNSKVVGFICVSVGENPDWGSYLDNLHVSKACQSKGLGKALLLEAAHRCYQQEPSKGMCLTVTQDNYKAREFYKKLGARNVQQGVWNVPDGSVVPTYWLVWKNLNSLIKNI